MFPTFFGSSLYGYMTASNLPLRTHPWPIPFEAVALIAQAEGCKLEAYLCPAGVPTIGFGETRGIKLGMKWTQAHADAQLCMTLGDFTRDAQKLLKRPATPNQLGAMVSLAFNIGIGAFANSSVLNNHNAGEFERAASSFGLWVKARVNGKLVDLPGLVTRRRAEAALYRKA